VIQVLAAIAVIVLVLIQHGKGADMGAAFGSGASGSLFGASGAANFLSRSTAVMATIFFIATLVLAYAATSQRTAHPATGGLISNEGDKGDAGKAPPAPQPGADVPAALPPTSPPAAAPAPDGAAKSAADGAAKAAGGGASDAKSGAPSGNEVPK